MPEEPQFTSDSLPIISQSEWYRRRVFEKAEFDPLYVMLGYLQEYFGGYALHDEVVDAFFVNEYEKAQFFKALCQHYLSSIGCEDDVELTKDEGGFSRVQSKLICEKLKGVFATREPDFSNHRCYQLDKDDDLYKTAEELYGNRSQFFNFIRYSYLLGLMIKNKLENEPAINFANAGHKAQLTIEILREFSAFGDTSLRVDYFFGAPQVTRITLAGDNEIWAAIEEFKQGILGTDKRG